MRFPIFCRLAGLVYAVLLAALLTLVGISRFVDWQDVARHGVSRNADWLSQTRTFEDGLEMALVPAGCFMMGSDGGYSDETPAHEQCFEEPFWIGRYEVTNAQYQEFVAAGGYADTRYWTAAGWQWIQERNITEPSDYEGFADPQQPRVGVSWYEAYAYASWLGVQLGFAVRLPTEAEWEYAVRRPDSLIYPWGNEFEAENVVYNGYETANVGSRAGGVSWVGAHDLSGNVWEWVSSLYEGYPYDETDGREQDTGDSTDAPRGLRGGPFSYNAAFSLRAAVRGGRHPVVEDDYLVGFRCARD